MEQCANRSTIILQAGVDEAGRGSIAGPVVAAAVILSEGHKLIEQGLMDSKVLSPRKREQVYVAIMKKSLAWAVGVGSVDEIDQINILQASLHAMQRAIILLNPAPQRILVDGLHCPDCDHKNVQAIVSGDATVAEISAASIIAKVVRDWLMETLDHRYPGYGFAQHKGYPTALHRQQLATLGVTPIHRRSFSPVRRYLYDN